MENEATKEKGFLDKVKDFFSGTNTSEVSATEVFFRTKYGSVMCPEDYVKTAQSYIRKVIYSRSDPSYRRSPEEALFRSYYCLIDIDSEMKDYIDQIFEPFVNAGFAVTKLSGRVEEIKEDYVYLVSWDKRNGV